MITVLLFGSLEEELDRFEDDIRYLTARRSDERLEFFTGRPGREKELIGDDCPELNMALIEVNTPGGLSLAKKVREHSPGVQIMVIAAAQVSPMTYLTPAIRPSALLLRPYDDVQMQKVLKDFFILALEPLISGTDGCYWAKTKDGTRKIAYSSIFYIEAREKRLFIRTKGMEYGIGGTIEKLQEELPDNFVRCHRSYIINRDYIERVRLTDGLVSLAGSMEIPLSRKYRGDLKGWMNG